MRGQRKLPLLAALSIAAGVAAIFRLGSAVSSACHIARPIMLISIPVCSEYHRSDSPPFFLMRATSLLNCAVGTALASLAITAPFGSVYSVNQERKSYLNLARKASPWSNLFSG